MKVFDEFEKEFIKIINRGKLYSRNVTIFLYKFLDSTRIQVDINNNTGKFLFQCLKDEPTDLELQWAIEKEKELIEVLIRLLTLIKYLEKEDLITVYKPTSNNEPIIKFGRGADKLPFFEMAINDQNLTNLFIRYLQKEIVPSPALRKLEKNRFHTDSEIQFKKNQIAIWVAIIVSFFIGVVGFFFDYQNNKSNAVQIKAQLSANTALINDLKKSLKAINSPNIDYVPYIQEISQKLEKISSTVEMTITNRKDEIRTIGSIKEKKQ